MTGVRQPFALAAAGTAALGALLAAGEPLPPSDPDDDRMSRPMPRGDES